MAHFIWKGINSKEHVVLERVPLTTRPERDTQIIQIPNDEPIIYETDTYKPVPITLQLGIRDTSNEHMDFLNEWLSGTDKLIFDTDPERYHVAVCNGNLTGNRLAQTLGKMPVSFTLMPFLYSIHESEWEEVPLKDAGNGNKQAWIFYEGTQPSKPTIRVHCNGDLHLQWGTMGIDIPDIIGYCTIDVGKLMVWDYWNNIILNRTSGDISKIRLSDGIYILVNSNVNGVQIKKNPRWKS